MSRSDYSQLARTGMQKSIALIVTCGTIIFSLPAWAADANNQGQTSVQSAAQPWQTAKPVQAPQSVPSLSQSSQALPPTQATKPPLGEVDYWIDPDRPHIADSSVNVPKGLMLQENGFQQSYASRRSSIFDFPETLMRLGVTNRDELRYNLPNFFTQSAPILNTDLLSLQERTTSFQNMQAGFKHRLGPLGPTKFQISVNPFISIPTGFSKQSSRVDPFIKFPFSQEINERWDIEGMQSLFDPTGPDGHRNLDWQNSLVLNRSWGRQKNAFIEYVGDVFQHGPMSNIIHFGAAYRPTRRQQVDVQFGFRMNNAAPVAFFGFGYSFLLGSLNNPRLTPSRFQH